MTSLTINVHDLPAALPASLEERLQRSPTKSPEELESALKAYEAKSSKVRHPPRGPHTTPARAGATTQAY